MDECVFCSRVDQPGILFEMPSLYVMPDKFPLLPGHILIISKRHLRCHAEGPSGPEEELDAAAARVRRFLREVYGTPALAWENGVFGQTVFHAHLHLLPIRAERFPVELDEQREITRIESWQPVRRHYEHHGGYRYMELGSDRRLIAQGESTLQAVRRWLMQVTGVEWDGRDWLRTTTSEDVGEVTRRWSDWAGKRRAGD
jgi:diadenosine tetraphosphate (Ap4A) HIT family hydrolase